MTAVQLKVLLDRILSADCIRIGPTFVGHFCQLLVLSCTLRLVDGLVNNFLHTDLHRINIFMS